MDFHYTDQLEETIRRGRRDLHQVSELIARYQSQLRDILQGKRAQVLEDLAGPTLPPMLYRREEVQQSLASPVANVRIAALLLSRDYWKPTEAFSRQCSELAFGDKDARVRGVAIYALLRCYDLIPDMTLRFVIRTASPSTSLERIEDVIQRRTSRRSDSRGGSNEQIVSRWRALVGSAADDMAANPALVHTYLGSSEPNLRMAALSIGARCIQDIEPFAATAKQMVLDDADLQVRERSVAAISEIYAKTDDRHIGQFLAKLVYDAAESTELRRAAYSALFRLRGRPTLSWPYMRRDLVSTEFSANVDWAFVESFLPN